MKIMLKRGKISLRLIIMALTILHAGCAAGKPELKAGGLYSVDDGDGTFRVVKILVLDEDAAHIAIYANKFSTRPETIDPASLTFEGVGDGEMDIGIMHLPLSREAFARDRPVFITQTPVTEEELEGYYMWKEGGGKVFP